MEEIAYALITPYSLHKSRTGGIIGRLFLFSNLEFVGARMYAPSHAFVDEYSETIEKTQMDEPTRRALKRYINENLRPGGRLGFSNRTMLLLFRGENAVKHLRDNVIGPLAHTSMGDTIRGTYGDFIQIGDEFEYFEPAVLTGPDFETNLAQLEILAKYADTDGGILENVIKFPRGTNVETTLVFLKPDNFKKASSTPGNMIDTFSKTGLYIVGAKLLRFSIAQAEEFYAPLLEIFEKKLKSSLAEHLKRHLSDIFDFRIREEHYEAMAEILKKDHARGEFNKIIQYMTGYNPEDAKTEEDRHRPGREISLALLYQGERAVNKIRERLGVTDPSMAAPGTVRSAFGKDLMKNAAHASDSVESAQRERKIIDFWENHPNCDVKILIEEHIRRVSRRREAAGKEGPS